MGTNPKVYFLGGMGGRSLVLFQGRNVGFLIFQGIIFLGMEKSQHKNLVERTNNILFKTKHLIHLTNNNLFLFLFFCVFHFLMYMIKKNWC